MNPATRTSGGWLEGALAWTLLVLMVVPDNFEYVKLAGDAPTAGSATSRILWIALIVLGTGSILARGGLAWELLRALNPFLLLFTVLAVASITWSIAPEVTMRRCIRVVAILVVSLALMLNGWHPRRFQNVVRPIITLLLAGSIVFGLMNPQLAIHWDKSPELNGAWHGLANHKNSFGALSCVGVILWANAFFAREVPRWQALIGTSIACACLVLSKSTTSIMTTAFAVILLAGLQQMPRGLRPYNTYLVSLFVGALVFYSLISLRLMPGADLILKPIAHMAGKDVSFTGRTEIWAVISENIRYHWLLGSGYGAYWIGPIIGSPSYRMIERVMFYPGSAHNGYLDITNDLGFVGLFCLLGFLVVYVRQMIQLMRFNHSLGALFLALFLQQTLTNLSESHWFWVLSVGFVISSFSTAALARALLHERTQQFQAWIAAQRAPARHGGIPQGAQRVGA